MYLCVFFFKQKTEYELRISDWSADVCSSDLCSAVGFTIYPGAEYQFEMIEEIREITLEARSVGLAVVIWSYPRGGNLSKDGETAIDVCAYARSDERRVGKEWFSTVSSRWSPFH